MKNLCILGCVLFGLLRTGFVLAQDSLQNKFSPIVYHDYQIFAQKDSLFYIFKIQKDDSVLFAGRFASLNYSKVINFQPDSSQKPIYLKDINGDGVEELIWEEYTGGAHCCTNWWIFSLGDKFKQLAKLEALDGYFQLVDVDKDQIWEILTQDYCFIYWNGLTLANMDAPEVVLSWQSEQYLPDRLKMRKPVDTEKLRKEATELRMQTQQNFSESDFLLINPANAAQYVDAQIWMKMAQLIYTQNQKWVYKFLDWALVDKLKPYKKQYISELETKLNDCPFFPRKNKTKPIQK